jgi:hypothetical protein
MKTTSGRRTWILFAAASCLAWVAAGAALIRAVTGHPDAMPGAIALSSIAAIFNVIAAILWVTR